MAGRSGRRERPLDPQEGPLERFALGLRELRDAAGLTYLKMADAAHFSASSLSQAAAGHRLPTRDVLLGYVRACGGNPAEWEKRWERVRHELYGWDAKSAAAERRDLEPTEPTSFVGREREIAVCGALLERRRLVTLVGVGGVGKTRLAKRIVLEMDDRFTDGTYCVELADLGSGQSVGEAVATAVGVQAGPGQDPLRELAVALNGRSVLLLLDNCEHLLDSSARTVRSLLPLLPSLRVLATSRQPLDVDAEHVLQVKPLDLPLPTREHPQEADAAAPDAVVSPALTLFTDRAEAASPGFRVTESNRDTVTRVCRRLDGLPLALEIAARRLRTLTPEELLERLDHRFRLLGPGGSDRTAPPRHQALRALFDWSYELCTTAERTAWQQLSLCSGGVLLADAEWLCGAGEGAALPDGAATEDVFEALAGLVDKSLLTKAESDGGTRLHMLETVRAYGQERLAEDDRTQFALRRHRAWYLGLAAQAGLAYGTSGQAAWLRRLRAEHPNLRQIVTTSPPAGESAEILLDASVGFWLHCLTSGNVGEGARWMRVIIERHPQPPDAGLTAVWCRAVWVAGFLVLLHGDHDSTVELADRGEQALLDGLFPGREAADRTAHRIAGVELAAAFLQLRSLKALLAEDTESATRYALSSLAVGGGRTTLLTRQQCIAQLGFSAVLQGDHVRATELLGRALALSEAQGNAWHRCYLLWALAVGCGEAGRATDALVLLQRAIRYIWDIDERMGEATLSETLAWVLAAHGEARSAAVVLGAVDRVWSPFGAPRLFGFALMTSYRERGLRHARASLGEIGYAQAYQEGRRLGLRRALEQTFLKIECFTDRPNGQSTKDC
ncbi:AAA family ATPase [Streptomyces sp. KL116D]|uniref:ATP-binding protein n=1 Tax=Streptomyces sp. KL116D TaxID=3045152 RepID=UPI003557CDAD